MVYYCRQNTLHFVVNYGNHTDSIQNRISLPLDSRITYKIKMAAAMEVDDEALVASADKSGNKKRFEVKKARTLIRTESLLNPYLTLILKAQLMVYHHHHHVRLISIITGRGNYRRLPKVIEGCRRQPKATEG